MTKKQYRLYTLLCALVYFMGYLTRQGYAASLAEIILNTGSTTAAASLAVTGAFVTYGLGQLLSGFVGDRISPRLMIPAGLTGTAICNLLISFLTNIRVMTAVWCVNGLFQAMLWPPLLRAMTDKLSTPRFRTANTIVCGACSAATVLVYLLVPLAIRVSSWRAYFPVAAVAAFATGAVWFVLYDRFPAEVREKDAAQTESAPAEAKRAEMPHMKLSLILIALGILMQGVLRDGVLSMTPVYLSEKFDLGSVSSILTTVLLPVFSVLCIALTARVVKRFPNEIFSSLLFFLPALAGSFVPAFANESAVLPIALSLMLCSGCMHGVNMLLTGLCMVRFRATGRVASIGGFLNAFTYAGSAISTYFVARLSDVYGWDRAIFAWPVAALLGCLLLALELPVWMKDNRLSLTGKDR